jgi:hypothetical protein
MGDEPASLYLFREVDTGMIKVGVSSDPLRRLRNIQVGNASPIELLALVGGDSRAMALWAERLWKDKFVTSHKRGEWYHPTDDVLLAAETLEADWKSRAPTLRAGVPFFGDLG